MQSTPSRISRKASRTIPLRICLAISFCLCGAMCGPADHSSQGAAHSPLAVSRVVHIPLRLVGDLQKKPLPPNEPGFLVISPGSEDELPEGPNAFEVLDDGGVIISDPLLNRLVVFDSAGNFKRALSLGFASDEVTQLENGALGIRRANTDALYQLDSKDVIRASDPAIGMRGDLAGAGVAKRVSLDHGTIVNRMQGRQRIADPLDVHYVSDTTQMVALRSLATNAEGATFVALTVTSHATDAVKTNTIVRKYSRSGELLCQTAELPSDYVVFPTNPIRVRNNMIYHMIPGKDAVTIKIWNTTEYK
jgi:hypothetical protein